MWPGQGLTNLRDERAASTVAPWSPRARPGPPVGMPFAWDVGAARSAPGRFTLATLAGAASPTNSWPTSRRSASRRRPDCTIWGRTPAPESRAYRAFRQGNGRGGRVFRFTVQEPPPSAAGVPGPRRPSPRKRGPSPCCIGAPYSLLGYPTLAGAVR
ncbi:hypothetical protein [Arenibaculum sp.]|uniref:non-homologous end-joining DNA ligase LigD n=1 Tax=Arenibaculum sp. TaxID=2865862 RepID=UPI002E129715|nr:hypothetical protein [Arenibaculum sp.]